MQDYKQDHYRFKRQSGFKRRDFDEAPHWDKGDTLVLATCVAILILILMGVIA